jgi:hypothetical protein
MTYPEAVFCRSEEYYAHEKERLDSAYLNNGELYSIMFSLEHNGNKREAAKLPATIIQKVVDKSGMYVVKMALHDPDLKPALQTEGHFEDGFWLNVREKIFINEKESSAGKYKPEEAYIMSYSDPTEDSLQKIVAKKDLVLTV